jgi:hypothetical protein
MRLKHHHDIQVWNGKTAENNDAAVIGNPAPDIF